MISFVNPEALWLLFILLPGFALGVLGWRTKRRLSLLFGVSPQKTKKNQVVKYFLFSCAAFFAIIVLAVPRIEMPGHLSSSKTGEIILLTDVSRSMDARLNPESPSRLERAKDIELSILREFPEARFSVCGFLSMARCLTPLTQDNAYVKRTIEMVLDINSVPGSDTDIGSGILDVVGKFSQDEKARIIVLLSDGGHYASDYSGFPSIINASAVAAVGELTKLKIKLIIIGVGEKKETTIPLYDEEGRFTGKYAEYAGQVFQSRLEEEPLLKIAEAAQGKYFSESDQSGPKDLIATSLTVHSSREEKDYRDITFFLLIPAAFFSVLYLRHIH